ncbi:MAG: hypothetical protein DMF61_17930 [Blastocatellia bacterium AA13]|nr:MAG: hypothetical protein DMF61_17930 [Blastocatellia bacterium AA13]
MEQARPLIDMSDYNRGVRVYWWTTVSAGLLVTAWAIDQVLHMSKESDKLAVAALMVLALLASLKPTRVPGTQAVITPADVFVFLAAVVFGPAGATLVAVTEASFVSYRTSDRWTSRLGGPALMAIAVSVSTEIFWLTAGGLKGAVFLAALLGLSIIYFFLNSLLLATHQSLKRRVPLFTLWKVNYSWASLTYIASAATAGLVHMAIGQPSIAAGEPAVAVGQEGIAALVAPLPLIAIIYATCRLYFVRAEERLVAAERISLILNNTSDVIFSFNLEGRVTYVNPAVQVLTGYTAQEASDHQFLSLVHPDDLTKLSTLWLNLVDGRQCSDEEFKLVTRDGKSKWCSGSWGPIFNDRSEQIGVQGHIRDISDRKMLQAQLLHSQKMEAIGRLAGGVAHDFNNLLTAIIGYCEMALDGLPRSNPAHDRVKQVLKAGERAESLTRQLLAFSRRQMLVPVVIDLSALVDDVNKLLRRLIGEDTELIAVSSPGLGRVKADPGQIEQVIVNLAVNARDAMPNGGRLFIRTGNVYVSEGDNSAHENLAPGEYVALSVTDTGCGMDAETASQIFEPFFTTKELGKGTGLGLSTVYGIIKQSGGEIAVETEIGIGTTFRIYLPRVDSESQQSTLDEAGAATRAGSETILVVEDDETLLSLCTEILTSSGYQALQASNGREALLICEQYGGPIHLMLTDLVMPKMNGCELADRVASIRSEMKVLFMSGYTDEVVGSNGFSIAGRPFLPKPFTPDSLARKVREVLDQAGHARTAGQN